MDGSLAQVLGRPDLATSAATMQVGNAPLIAGSGSFTAPSGSVQGKISLGIFGAIVVSLVVFYVWSKPLQK